MLYRTTPLSQHQPPHTHAKSGAPNCYGLPHFARPSEGHALSIRVTELQGGLNPNILSPKSNYQLSCSTTGVGVLCHPFVSFVGHSAARLGELFTAARKLAHFVVFIDGLDAVGVLLPHIVSPPSTHVTT